MSVEYTHYLIPTRPLQRPNAARIAALIGAMRGQGWLGPSRLRGEGPRFTSDLDAGRLPTRLTTDWLRARRSKLRIRWGLDHGSRFPLTSLPRVGEEASWSLELHWSRYFLPTDVDGLSRARSIKTSCGEPVLRRPPVLTAKHPFQHWLLTKCPQCRLPYDPESSAVPYTDPWTGGQRAVAGLGLHRFALVIDCGASIPSDPGRAPLRVHPDLVELASRHLACTFHDDLGGIT